MRTSFWLRCWLALLLAAALGGCAVSPYAAGPKAGSDALLAQQITQARAQMVQGSAPRLLFAGLAMDDRSEAFRRDVLLSEQVARLIDPQAVVLKLANPRPGHARDLPFATRENIETVLQTIAALARPQDKLLLVLSAHGGPGLLALHAGGQPLGMVSAAELARWTAPLRERAAVVVISACFSGSFIPALRQDRHIVLTAAAANRASFGCNTESDNTFFIKALFGQPEPTRMTLQQLMQNAIDGVGRREQLMQLVPPSAPRYQVGSQARSWWSGQPLGDWLKPVAPATESP